MGSRKPLTLVAVLAVLLSLTAPVFAQQQSGGLAVAVIIDSSGSMLTNDRNQVGLWAAKRLVTMLGENEQVTVISFSDQASVMVPLRNVGAAASKAEIFSGLDRLGYRGNSDIKGSLQLALAELAKAPPTKKRLAVLISDGDPDLPQLVRDPAKMAAYLADTVKVAGQYKTTGAVLYCVATRRTAKVGPLPGQIADAGGGKLFIASDIPGLMEFFQVVASLQEVALYTPPELYFQFEKKPVTAGENLPLRAGLKVWGEPLVPGKDATISRFTVTAVQPDGKTETLDLKDSGLADDADERGGDGVYSGKVKFPAEGTVKLSVEVQGSYRGRRITENASLGEVTVRPVPSVRRDILSFLQGQKNLGPIAAGIVGVLLLLVAISAANRRVSQNVRASLKYWPEKDRSKPVTLDLSRLRKKNIVVSTDDHAGRDFTVPVIERPFGFMIRKFNKFTDIDFGSDSDVLGKEAYVIIGIPGTFLLFEEEGRLEGMPRTRKQVFDGDRFTVRGYVFEFLSPDECARRRSSGPKGRNS